MKSEKPSGPPPIICLNDRVVLHYAVLTDSVGFNAGHGLFLVGKKEIGPVPCLAISRDRQLSEVTLYYCDRYWKPIGIASHESVEAAKRRAERIYPGSSSCWVEAHFSDEDVNRYLDEPERHHGRRKRSFRIGDKVKVVGMSPVTFSPGVKDELGTEKLFKSMLGKIYTVRGFDKLGNVELQPKRLDTVWVEPEFLKLRARKTNKRKTK